MIYANSIYIFFKKKKKEREDKWMQQAMGCRIYILCKRRDFVMDVFEGIYCPH